MEGQRRHLRYRSLLIGGGLLALGLLMPLLLNVENMGIYNSLQKALAQDEKIYVVAAAFQLLTLNVLRGFPNYLGAYFIADGISSLFFRRGAKGLALCAIMFPLLLLEYRLILRIYRIRYAFGVPAMVTLALMLVLVMVDLTLVSDVKKCFTAFFIHGAVQCLDVMPMLAGSIFGMGETSREILTVSHFLEADGFLNVYVLVTFVLMAVSAVLYTVLVADENHIRLVSIQKEQQERALMEARMAEQESRSLREVHHVAHDLKTPLTSIQTLIGILELGEGDEKRLALMRSIETSVEHMNRMITETLDENRFFSTSAAQILREVMAQVSIAPYVSMIEVKSPGEELVIQANRIRLGRALVNLLENAYYAVDPQQGHIVLSAEEKTVGTERFALFQVRDNGRGIRPENMSMLFERGFSTRGSSGLGLPFVKEVVEAHKGTIQAESEPGKGTSFLIMIPEEAEGDE